ncbi:MAG: DUF1902 domain-containing protein [Burkholderiaceae bacterium]|jgi:hypothetical protein|nr:DUF1902 domain-containing protein [Burkholderiaceae bacterium]
MSQITEAKRQNAMFHVSVIYDSEADKWVGVCDALPVATEADTWDELVERFWAIAPEIAQANKPGIDVGTMRLRFEYEDCALDHQHALV